MYSFNSETYHKVFILWFDELNSQSPFDNSVINGKKSHLANYYISSFEVFHLVEILDYSC